jgi:poly-D-alanine transfer protein DltD
MTLKEYEKIRKQMEKDGEAGYEDLAERSSEPNYVSEGQRGYVSVDKEAD